MMKLRKLFLVNVVLSSFIFQPSLHAERLQGSESDMCMAVCESKMFAPRTESCAKMCAEQGQGYGGSLHALPPEVQQDSGRGW